MISEALRTTGWHIKTGAQAPHAIQVFGERSSGTNFVKRLIGRNSVLKPTEEMGWKHGFPQMTAIPAHIAIVCVVRDARAWALSMHAKPWHCPPAMQALTFSQFIRVPWLTIADRKRYFPQVQQSGGQGLPLQLDRHPISGLPFANLFTLRRAKLDGLLSFQNRGCTLVFCRLEAVQSAPEQFLSGLHNALEVPSWRQEYRPVVKRLGSRFLPSIATRPETPKHLKTEDLAFLQNQLHPEQEAALGYDYSAV